MLKVLKLINRDGTTSKILIVDAKRVGRVECATIVTEYLFHSNNEGERVMDAEWDLKEMIGPSDLQDISDLVNEATDG